MIQTMSYNLDPAEIITFSANSIQQQIDKHTDYCILPTHFRQIPTKYFTQYNIINIIC